MSASIDDYRMRLRQALAQIQEMEAELEAASRELTEPVAIVGLACRFPGGANTPEEFQKLLEEGRDAVGEVPPERWPLPSSDTGTESAEARSTRWGAFLREIDLFDASFFGISPREAAHMDPQQRLLLEVTWEALERAGQVPGRLAADRVGVFLGLTGNDNLLVRAQGGVDALDVYDATGNGHCFPAGRISYTLGFRGPCLAVDTACSSSLVAAHLAAQSLRLKECDVALVGGVNLMLSPHVTNVLAKMRSLSPDGRCKAFDAQANGFVRGEGCGVVVLKRLADAQRDGDRILALILGSALNQDGRSAGFTAPNLLSQEAVLREALVRARVEAEDIGYIEAHGTGTSLGDPIEAEALRAVLGKPRADGARCVLGAVKTNIGHCESAAGVAGIIKTVLALQAEKIPKNIHFRALNPRISLDGTPFSIPTETVPWKRGAKPRRAGISSFGMSGTNAHLILEESPPEEPGAPRKETRAHLLPLSARSPEALVSLARAYGDRLRAEDGDDLLDITYTASVRRTHHEHRLAVVGRTRRELAESLAAFTRGEPPQGMTQGKVSSEGAPRLVFVFSGQGSQWAGMGEALAAEEPVFRAKLEECDRLLRQHVGWSLLEELGAPEPRSRLAETEVAQPALFAVQVALAELLRSWGVAPQAVIGHSVGEIAAAHVAGALSLEEAVRLAALRGRIMQRATGLGKMAWVALPPEEAAQAIAGQEERLAIAAINDPASVVLSGEERALDSLLAELSQRGVLSRPLRVNYAFHSPQMDPLARELAASLGRVGAGAGSLTMYSTVTGAVIAGESLDAAYWARNVRGTVHLARAVETALSDGGGLFLEVGPHPVLLANLQQCVSAQARSAQVVPSLRRGGEGLWSMLEALGGLHAHGLEVAWEKLHPAGGHCVSLPTYPWQRQRHWLEGAPAPRPGELVADPLEDDLYEVQWRTKEREARDRPASAGGAWLILADRGGAGEALAARLRERGEACVQVTRGQRYERVDADLYRLDPASSDDHRRLLEEAFGKGRRCRGVVHMFGLDAAPWGEATAEAILTEQRSGVAAASYLVRALLRQGWRDKPVLCLITRGAQAAGDAPVHAPAQAPLWGFARTLELEHPELSCTRIDLDPAENANDACALAEELLASDGEDMVALRGGDRFVARLVRGRLEAAPAPQPRFEEEASYLVTGGLGGLGLSTARWLVSRGAKHVALLDRAAPTAAALEQIQAMTAAGAQVLTLEQDVSRREGVEVALAAIAAQMPPLRGIVHAAGALGAPTPLSELQEEACHGVMAPQVLGALHLHELTRERPLDFFLLYSSASALLGLVGQASYAAGNAFLDALAHARRGMGLPATSIQWGTFAGMGPSERGGGGERIAQGALQSLTWEQGAAVLERLLARPRASIAVMRLSATQWIELFPQLAGAPFFTELLRAPQGGSSAPAERSFRPTLQAAAAGERLALLEAHVQEALARTLGAQPSSIDRHAPFQMLGVDSLMSLEVRNRLEASLGAKLPATLLFTYPNLAALAASLLDELGLSEDSNTVALQGSAAVAVAASRREEDEPIAIVGMACRFPGGGVDPDAFWRMLLDGVDGVRETTPARWAPEVFPDDQPAGRYAALIDDIDRFDADFFGISPREAEEMDPQQRLLLEVAWEALEDAGQRVDRLVGSRTGVFVGLTTLDYQQLLLSSVEYADAYGATGTMAATAAGRLSYVFGLQGPAMMLDTACSSSLVATHLACQSLRDGESEMALVCGVNALLSWQTMMTMATMQALSQDGRCKTFDARANGYVRGEGCGVLVLKRLSDAQRDKDPIFALIRGSAVNQDGRSTGLTTPNVLAQEALLRQAYERARVAPEEIGYIELHGTGTPLGDPIEADALKKVLGAPRPDGARCVLGAVKTNIGHLEAAAGVAGLIKTVQVLRHGLIPKNIHFRALNPRISLEGTPLAIAAQNVPWTRGQKPRLAGVSSFGISGTNAHVVLEEAPPAPAPVESPAQSAYLLPLSAKRPEALAALARSWAERLAAEDGGSLADIAHTASLRRAHHSHRLAAVGGSREELAQALLAHARGTGSASVVQGKVSPQGVPKVVFVFPGQGSQWLGMGRQLLAEEEVFRSALEACDLAIQQEAGFSVIAELTCDEPLSRLAHIDVVQPVLFAFQVALCALWRSWGIRPDCVVGHSMGEVAAAHVAGLLTLQDACSIICRRSKLLTRISGMGAMALVELSMQEASHALAGYQDRVSVAVSNGPRSTVLSGEPQALELIVASLEQRGVFCRRVKVDVASHSPQVEPLQQDLRLALAALSPADGQIPMLSTVTLQRLQGSSLHADYWWQNLRAPVRFSEATLSLIHDGSLLFLELSPHPILLPAIEENLREARVEGSAIASLRRQAPERRTLLEGLGSLYARGCSIAWERLYTGSQRCVQLPPYPWLRERFWLQPAGTQRARTARTEGVHPLLGTAFVPSPHPEVHCWEQWLSEEAFPYLGDHRVQGEVVFPGAGYVEMALAAGTAVYGPGAVIVEELSFERMLALPPGAERQVQVALVEEGGGRASVTIASRAEGSNEWMQHSAGTLRVVSGGSTGPTHTAPRPDEERHGQVIEGAEHYARMEERRLSYGKRFQGLQRVLLGEGEALGQVRLPEEVAREASAYQLHPALLDACFQAAGWAMQSSASAGAATVVPVRVARLHFHARPGREVWVRARMARAASEGLPGVEILVQDEAGRVLVEIGALEAQSLADAATSTRDALEDCAYEVEWRRADLALDPAPPPPSAAGGAWLVLADEGGLGRAIAARLRAQGEQCVEVLAGAGYERLGRWEHRLDGTDPAALARLLGEAFGENRQCKGVVHLWSVDGARWEQARLETLEAELRRSCLSALRLTQAVLGHDFRDVPRLHLVTRGAQRAGTDTGPSSVAQAPLWGLGRSIALEHPELALVCIDLADRPLPDEAERIAEELWRGGGGEQIALRAEGRYVARLRRTSLLAATPSSAPELAVPAEGRPFRLEIPEPGVLDRLSLHAIERRPPGPGEVEVEVEAAGLNFMDVMKAMGTYPGMESPILLGGECAGRIVALGEGVTGLWEGQEVIAVSEGTFATHVTTSARLVAPKPARLSFEQAATIPAVFMTVWWALHHVARLSRGERILIHSASGGTGLAAIQYARAVGAEIFATAGSEEKRDFLRSLGIAQVMDSRSLAFAGEVMERTGGRGVDVVLNSLAGEAATKSLEVLAPYGRFLELGKKDIYQNSRVGLLPFRKSLSYTAIDLAGMGLEKPELFASLLREVMERFEDGTFTPAPTSVFAASQADEAFRLMAQARHTGKIAVRMKDDAARIVLRQGPAGAALREDGTYLLTGGLGGLGLSLARWMVERGARHLVLAGRSGPGEAALEAICALEAAGAEVRVWRADVAQPADVQALLARIGAEMPPLRGIAHLAGVLDDRTLLEMQEEQLLRPLRPKAFGAWNLHEATRGLPLDFFVMYSSGSSLMGAPGQAGYAAANAFLDALAHARVAEALPGMSIQWGPFSEVGLAAAQANRGRRLSGQGVESFTPAEGEYLLGRLLEHPRTEVGLLRLTSNWTESLPQAARLPFFAELVKDDAQPAAHGEPAFLGELRQAPRNEWRELLERHAAEQLGRVLRLDVSRIDPSVPFSTLGMDSLMGLELRNRLEASLGLKLTTTLLFAHPTITALAEHLLGKLGGAEQENGAREEVTGAAVAAEPALAEAGPDNPRSDEEVAALLEAKLASLSRFLE
nr:polyketide synthase [Myxococcales bacterium]